MSGCILGGDGEEQSGPKAPAQKPTFDESTGAVRGRVVNLEQLPVAGASVGAVDEPAAAKTDADGNYVLGPLSPGTHVVQASALGYESTAKHVEVHAGGVTEGVLFELKDLPTDAPYHVTDIKKVLLSGVMWKATPTCVYTDVNPLVKTCGGVRLGCEPDECETHYGDDEQFTADWQTLVGEVTWTAQSGATGKGFSYDINAPNVTRGPGGSINQADKYTFQDAANRAPLVIVVQKADLSARGIKESDWNNPPPGSCGEANNCDWFWRLFPAAYDLGIGNEGLGPDYGVMYENPVEIYFTYFIREPAPEGWSALPER